jgi:hypothetical protein
LQYIFLVGALIVAPGVGVPDELLARDEPVFAVMSDGPVLAEELPGSVPLSWIVAFEAVRITLMLSRRTDVLLD